MWLAGAMVLAAAMTWRRRAWPPTSWRTLGRRDLRRVPLPAAMIAIPKLKVSIRGLWSHVRGVWGRVLRGLLQRIASGSAVIQEQFADADIAPWTLADISGLIGSSTIASAIVCSLRVAIGELSITGSGSRSLRPRNV